ncbi:MAG: hypothetical protein MJA30_27290 [Cytophagales bacterium]|nr:hypothetical protein [Cytophagales bacterium]
MSSELKILNTPAEELTVTGDLSGYMQEMDFNNLGEMLEFSIADLLKTPGFTYRCLQDLLQLLHENDCEHLLKPAD